MGREWTKPEIEHATALFKEGYSAHQIGVQVGRTRNSVISRLSRDGVMGNTDRARRINRAVDVKANRSFQRQPSSPLMADPDSDGMKLLSKDAWEPLPGTNPVPLEDVTGCRWPLGEIRDGTFCMCNAPKVEGSSYCATHKRASEPSR
ncbi:GcrA family cell cycle regulator [Pelagibacterium lentulum]|uniref:GcrA cell cycle regulator n=1 Tax=Pelagibacterium lentulum TaxID=2029865 RepID=A0A916W460_9HYPH|nr:hypothetical protein GCM10011499_39060 [Pelagibacterium lentulum]